MICAKVKNINSLQKYRNEEPIKHLRRTTLATRAARARAGRTRPSPQKTRVEGGQRAGFRRGSSKSAWGWKSGGKVKCKNRLQLLSKLLLEVFQRSNWSHLDTWHAPQGAVLLEAWVLSCARVAHCWIQRFGFGASHWAVASWPEPWQGRTGFDERGDEASPTIAKLPRGVHHTPQSQPSSLIPSQGLPNVVQDQALYFVNFLCHLWIWGLPFHWNYSTIVWSFLLCWF